MRTVTVLVIACPHALGLAIPLVIAISTSLGARNGILVKDRIALERMRELDAVLFDKTGTLTRRPHVVDRQRWPVPTTTDLRLAAAVEADSEHPLARAIVAAAPNARSSCPRRTGSRPSPGGRAAHGRWPRVAVGGPRLLAERGPSTSPDAGDDAWAARADRARTSSDGDGLGRWPWKTRSGPNPRRRSASCTTWAYASP